MDRKLDDFLFYFPRIVMALIGAAAFAFGAWFSQFYYLYLNCIVLPISWATRCNRRQGECNGAPYLIDYYPTEKGNNND